MNNIEKYVRDNAIIEYEQHLYLDETGFPISEKFDHRYTLTTDWTNGKRYGIYSLITSEAVEEVKFDITKQEIDRMIDKLIEKLDTLWLEEI